MLIIEDKENKKKNLRNKFKEIRILRSREENKEIVCAFFYFGKIILFPSIFDYYKIIINYIKIIPIYVKNFCYPALIITF